VGGHPRTDKVFGISLGEITTWIATRPIHVLYSFKNLKIKNMKVEFQYTRNLIEFLPAITYYTGSGEHKKGTLTFCWFRFSIKIYINI